MPADAYVMDADMKKVADAIRAKTGKADTMVFPDGFANEINGISSGVDLTIDTPPEKFKKQFTGMAPNLEGVQVSLRSNNLSNSIQQYSVFPETWPDAEGTHNLTVKFGDAQDTIALGVVNKTPTRTWTWDDFESNPHRPELSMMLIKLTVRQYFVVGDVFNIRNPRGYGFRDLKPAIPGLSTSGGSIHGTITEEAVGLGGLFGVTSSKYHEFRTHEWGYIPILEY